MDRLDYIAKQQGRLTVTGAPQGYDAYLVAEAARRRGAPVLFVAADDLQADAAVQAIAFFAPGLAVLPFPAWDCLPYDRVSPKSDIESRRLATLAALARDVSKPAVIVTTINALLQRVPPKDVIARASFAAKNGAEVDREALVGFLAGNGYVRAGTVREPGDFALRGGIVDLWPPGEEQPLRLDFFGSTLDAIRRFDAETQLSDKTAVPQIALLPASEAPLNAQAISRFRSGYVAAFGAAGDDPLYESVSAGRKTQGMEHWLPLFYERLDTLFDYLPRTLVLLSHQVEEAKTARLELIADYYDTREQFRHAKDDKNAIKGPPYKPLKPETLYLSDADWKAALAKNIVRDLTPFQAPESTSSVDAGGRQGRDFAPERQGGNLNVFQAA
ncbi:MAG TPA: hypothetical protein VHZ32_14680, partial [Rhizomicrobium sp.]|nr:hypothetical protein [Rhizomicrobium sp.]